ncbi:MAG: flagellar hook-basal body complex protein FliE [Planctomycetota bacterium]|jgi:flagellar hook-basal body complex protein FliE|nr:flagellar hook-basal body complex protein FliE [Planctomycetota bacterium]
MSGNPGILKVDSRLATSPQARRESASGTEFKQFLLDNLNKLNSMQEDAGKMVSDLVTGNEQDIGKVVTAVEKASVAFDTLLAVRNKLVDSYQDILRLRL